MALLTIVMILKDVHNASQKEANKAKAKKAAEAEEAQEKLADIMVEAQKKVRRQGIVAAVQPPLEIF